MLNDAVAGTALAGVREFILVPVARDGYLRGWLLALNRSEGYGYDGQQPPYRCSHLEFGTAEATLLSSAASMLAAHAGNVELFRERERLLTDSHLHLHRREFNPDRPEVLARAEAAGVRRFLNVGYDPASSRESVELAENDRRFFATVGVHPHDAALIADPAGHLTEAGAEVLAGLEELAARPRVVAIGEIGLDFFRDLSPRPAQRTALGLQLELADWYQWNGREDSATRYYAEVEHLLAESGDQSVLREWFGQPVELPDNGAFWQPGPPQEGQRRVVVEASFDVSERGRASNIETQVANKEDGKFAALLRRKLARTRFRPQYAGGQFRSVAGLSRQYELVD